MKLLLALSLMLFSAFSFAEPVRFICEDGDDIEFLVLDENSAELKGESFINTTPMDDEMEYRGYSFINDPWMSLTVTTNMLREENGYAYLLIENVETGESVNKEFSCFPAEVSPE